MKNLFSLLIVCLSILFFTACEEDVNYVQPLFDGINLSNFEILNGEAEFEVKDSCIVGISKLNTPNTFLATKEKYGDFILEFEVLSDASLNSGVQIRSNTNPDYLKGRVHGYQVEIESSPRKWAGGIYDEARRGWMYPLSVNEDGQNAFKVGEWNHYRIEAIGPNIRTWVNDIQCANLVDDMTAEGFIAFQVHSIGDSKQENKEVRWRNITIQTDNLLKERKMVKAGVREISYLKNELSNYEKRQAWRLLFDGETGDGWTGIGEDEFPSEGWKIENGELIITDSSTNLISDKTYQNFELELDFKMQKNADSGIGYLAVDTIGLEYQIIDDQHHINAKNPTKTLASLYDIVPARNLSEPKSNTKRAKGLDRWNKARILCKDGKVQHWLNDIKVLEFSLVNQAVKDLVQTKKGAIILQNRGSEVRFRSIKILEL